MTARRALAMAGVACAVALVLGACSASTAPGSTAPTSTVPTSTVPTSTATPAGTSSASTTSASSPSATATPVVGHVVVVMMENHSYSDIVGSSAAPYLNSLARSGADLTSMFAIRHPSQPNYVALFSGSINGVTNDVCPQTLTGPNLGTQLRDAGLTFTGYSEGLPNTGNNVCLTGRYVRRHVPWTNFADLPGTVSVPFTEFPHDFSTLPALSFVIPNLDHDMHDGTIAEGDAWVRSNLQAYAAWATTHHSQLVITWDEDDRSENNQIPTIIVGAGITPQKIGTHLTLYSLLRYLEDRFGLAHLGAAETATPIPLAI